VPQDASSTTRSTRVLNSLSVGLAVGVLSVVNELSFATLIFAGSLSGQAVRATALPLFGGLALGLVALFSNFKASVSIPQDTPTAILAPTAAAMAVSLAGAGPEVSFATVAAAMGLSTLATAVVFLLLGRFRLGDLGRFMPYPVIGGFLAGTGWLLLSGSFGIMTGAALHLDMLDRLVTIEALLKWVPGAAMALILFFGLRRYRNFLILPGTLGLSLALFFLFLHVSGLDLDGARAQGLLLQTGGEAPGWPAFGLKDLALVRWDVILSQAGPLLTIPLLASISLLLNASGVELGSRRDVDLNRELVVNGLGNLVGGLGCSHAGYTTLSLSLFGANTGAYSRLVGLTSAAVCGAVLFLGAGFVGASPRFLLGGLVFFIGLATLWDWLVDGWRRMPLSDYILVLGILLVIVHFGFLTGVGVGLAAAIGLFVVNYSRISVVREQSDGARMRSTVERPVPHERILREHGGRIAVFRLQGFLFFGTANALLARLTARMHDTAQPLLCILLDFRQVFGFDISALNSFHRLAQVARTRNVHMVLTAAPSRFLVQLGRAAGPDAEAFQIREDLDRGLEWCEDRLLEAELEEMERRRAQGGQDDFFLSVVDDLMLHLEQKERFEEIAERLGPWLEERTYKPGEVIIAQGRPLEGLFLLLRGTAREYVERENVASLRLRTMGPGATAGELGAASGRPALSSVAALSECRVGLLPAARLARLEQEDPALALDLHKLLGELLEQRLLARTALTSRA
jgi:SulP family sulfate permease